MDFLAICRRARQECGAPGDGPVTVVGQNGENKRIVDWCAQAYVDIQERRPSWDWMRADFAFDTTAGKQAYSPADAGIDATFAAWRPDSLRIYRTSGGVNGEIHLPCIRYDVFRDSYLLGSLRTAQSMPVVASIAPNKDLLLAFTPNDEYTVVGEYFTHPVTLTADADVPAMPARFHMAIVYRAMMSYGNYVMAPEIYQRGLIGYNDMMRKLDLDQLPPVVLPGAIA